MARDNPPFLNIYRVRGRPFAYYRRNGAQTRLCTPDGNPVDPTDRAALLAAWARAHEAAEAAARPAEVERPGVRPRSIAHLIAEYRASTEWASRKPNTRADYEKGLRVLEADFGTLPVIGLTPVAVRKIQRRYAWREATDRKGEPIFAADGKPLLVSNNRQANRVVAVLSVLMSFCRAELGWISVNPCEKPRKLPPQTRGYVPWPIEAYATFCAAAGSEWAFNAMFALLTAQRGQDQVAIRWDAYDGQGLTFVQQKGGGAVEVYVTVADTPLQDELDARKKRARALTILETPAGLPWTRNAYAKACSLAIKAAGLRGLTWHGLRGSAASWLEEEGEAIQAAQALLGHRTRAMTEHYGRGARQKRLAARATATLVTLLPKRQA